MKKRESKKKTDRQTDRQRERERERMWCYRNDTTPVQMKWDPTWVHFVEEILPGIHPDLSHTGGILVDDFGYATRERIGRLIAKNVTNVRTRNDLQLAPTLPDLVHNSSPSF